MAPDKKIDRHIQSSRECRPLFKGLLACFRRPRAETASRHCPVRSKRGHGPNLRQGPRSPRDARDQNRAACPPIRAFGNTGFIPYPRVTVSSWPPGLGGETETRTAKRTADKVAREAACAPEGIIRRSVPEDATGSSDPANEVSILAEWHRGADSIAEFCRRAGIATGRYDRRSKKLLGADGNRPAGHTIRQASHPRFENRLPRIAFLEMARTAFEIPRN